LIADNPVALPAKIGMGLGKFKPINEIESWANDAGIVIDQQKWPIGIGFNRCIDGEYGEAVSGYKGDVQGIAVFHQFPFSGFDLT
jgi:hypothetical protein